MIDIFNLTLDECKEELLKKGEKPFRASQIFSWLYKKGVSDVDSYTDISPLTKQVLKESFCFSSLILKSTVDSEDQETTKFLWELRDGTLVESVLIRSPERYTVCVSSQVGCPARCAFCASGKKGLMRNLTTSEILEQIYFIDQMLRRDEKKVSHVVFMGMGEPFENYDAVVKTIRLLIDPNLFGLSQRKITVSTVGIIEGIKQFTKEGLQVNLVLSLHAPNQRIRQKIIPYARKYALDDLLDAMLDFAEETNRDITYEYTLMKGINDSLENAKELAKLVKGHPCTVNLIPYNPVEGLKLRRPEKETIFAFRDLLQEEGISVTWRYTKGKDIKAACGQLAMLNDPTQSKQEKLALITS